MGKTFKDRREYDRKRNKNDRQEREGYHKLREARRRIEEQDLIDDEELDPYAWYNEDEY